MPGSARPPRFGSATRRSRFSERAGVRVRHHPVRDDPRRARGHVRVGRRRRPGSPTGGGDRRGVPQRDRRRRPRPEPGEAATVCRGDRWPFRRRTGSSRDMAQLGVVRPTYEPRSRDYVDEVIALAAHLLSNGAAYERNGSVYFRGADVASRAGLDRASAMELARASVAVTPTIRTRMIHSTRRCGSDPPAVNRRGRALGVPGGRVGTPSARRCRWRRLARPSTFTSVGRSRLPASRLRSGPGRGLHRSATLRTAWMHVGSVRVDGEKMAKSTGNLVYVHDVLDRYPPGALRLLILSRPWSEPGSSTRLGSSRPLATSRACGATACSQVTLTSRSTTSRSPSSTTSMSPQHLPWPSNRGGKCSAILVVLLGLS